MIGSVEGEKWTLTLTLEKIQQFFCNFEPIGRYVQTNEFGER